MATFHLETDLFVTDVVTRRRSRRGSDGRLSGQLGRRRGWISWKFVESVVVKSLKFKELAVSIDRRSGGWMVGKLGSIIIVTKVAGTIHVKFDIKLASRNDLAFQGTALIIAHLMVIGKLATTGWTTGSHASSEQRSVVVVRAAVVVLVVSSSSSTATDDCVLCDENRTAMLSSSSSSSLSSSLSLANNRTFALLCVNSCWMHQEKRTPCLFLFCLTKKGSESTILFPVFIL